MTEAMRGEAAMGRSGLVRSTNERWLAGVCGGIAARLGVSPLSVRIGWLILSLLPGPMWVVYVVLWIILPEEPT